ncbi:DUF6371 domain-containing protein, partial [uncultured Mucilaginibacter sp.]|uniref:DUF6965 family protein n=1 Tax=uncultured Mucilaginibacter sp. TaxID=797541 RepID=UPI0025F5ED3C
MSEHRYILEPYKGMKTRYRCPGCNHRDKTFSLYLDTQTGEHLNPTVGRCSRESKCGYHYTPKQYFQDNDISFGALQPNTHYIPKVFISQQKPVSFIPVNLFKESLKDHKDNNFVKFLISLFGVGIVNELISKYFIGTSKHWPGSTVFWQIDKQGHVRTGKIMLYSPSTGKRVKKPYRYINWVHAVLKLPEYELKQCLFGEHLLKDKTKPVAIVESEKTAIIASAYLPGFVWLAAGSLLNFTAEKCLVLAGRNVCLFPDLNGFDKWKIKAGQLSELMPGTSFIISDLLQSKASEADKLNGLDLADYLISYDYKEFIDNGNKTETSFHNVTKPVSPLSKKVENSERLNTAIKKSKLISPETHFKPFRKEFTQLWDITELETYFKAIPLPKQPIKLDYCSIVFNVKSFIDSHLEIVKHNNGNPTFLPYLTRLLELKQRMLQ